MKKRILSLLLAFSMVISLTLITPGYAQKASASVSNTSKSTTALWDAGTTRNKIVVLSDIHLGIEDKYTETLKNLPLLIEFLQRLENTKDVRELIIAGDFLDSWFLPVYYPSYTNEKEFFKGVVANNKTIIDELNKVIDSGIKLVYVVGNHDMTLEASVLQEAIPKIVQVNDAKGVGAYYTGDRKEIVIEHGHRYEVFSAPDTVTNAELCGNNDTILPAGYFYARYAATWVLEGRPKVEKDLPVVKNIPAKTDTDQFGAYIYYSILSNISARMTPKEGLNEKIFKMHIAGFNNDYTFLDFYPVQMVDGTISAPVLYKNIQRTWAERQKINKVKVPNSFIEAASGTLDWNYFFKQAKVQYLENKDENVDVVVFGHTHVPSYRDMGDGKYYINDGTWIDNNTNYPEATRTFAVITTGNKDTALLYKYAEDGTVIDISASVSKAEDKNAAATETAPAVEPLDNVKFDMKTVKNYGDEATQARYIKVSGLADDKIQAKLNKELKKFCLEPTYTAKSDTTYDIMPVFEVVDGNLLSIRTYNTAYSKGAAYPVNSIRTQLFNLTTGDKNAGNLWDFIKDKDAFKKLVLNGKFNVTFVGVDGKISKKLKAAAYKKLAKNIASSEFASQFYFGDGGYLNVWCEGQNHATGDYWLFDIPVVDLEGLATDRLLPIIDTLKKLSN